VDAAKAYDCVVNLDHHVRVKHIAHTLPHMVNPPVGQLPREYLRWANSVDAELVDKFWEAIAEGDWREAKRISGLSTEVIADILNGFHDHYVKLHGSFDKEYYVCGMRLHEFLFIIDFELSEKNRAIVRRYINKRNAPPFNALPIKAKMAFEELARKVGEHSGTTA